VIDAVRPTAIDLHRAAALLAEKLPTAITHNAVRVGGQAGASLAGDRRLVVERNLERAGMIFGSEADRRSAIGRAFASYGRYYVDSFRLPSLSASEVDAGFRHEGFEYIRAALGRDAGPILVLPHLGGWEWAAYWLHTQHQIPVSAVVEPLEPPELFTWFKEFREEIGMRVISAGGDSGSATLRSVRENRVTCLLADRVVGEVAGVPVEFFGEKTLLPAGPAALALRTGAPLLPTAVYFDDDHHFARVLPPLDVERQGRFREDVHRVTQLMANALEELIRGAPEQWHLLQPNWPSDYQALGRPIPERYAGL